jgi:hypothetical protein
MNNSAIHWPTECLAAGFLRPMDKPLVDPVLPTDRGSDETTVLPLPIPSALGVPVVPIFAVRFGGSLTPRGSEPFAFPRLRSDNSRLHNQTAHMRIDQIRANVTCKCAEICPCSVSLYCQLARCGQRERSGACNNCRVLVLERAGSSETNEQKREREMVSFGKHRTQLASEIAKELQTLGALVVDVEQREREKSFDILRACHSKEFVLPREVSTHILSFSRNDSRRIILFGDDRVVPGLFSFFLCCCWVCHTFLRSCWLCPEFLCCERRT